jgi:hypothetical protein
MTSVSHAPAFVKPITVAFLRNRADKQQYSRSQGLEILRAVIPLLNITLSWRNISTLISRVEDP